MTRETERVEGASHWYLERQLDIDKRLIRFRYQTLKPHLQGPEGLELGSAEGEMTRFLLQDFERLTVVDGSAGLLSRIPDASNLVKVHGLFEEFQPDRCFNTIIADHILEHVEQPVNLLRRMREWVANNGRIAVGVPNAHSIHRLVAVKMGLLKHPCELNARDRATGHRRVYTSDSLQRDLAAAGLRVVEKGGIFFKPLSYEQIQDHWTEEMILGFFELGKDFPEHAADLYAVCERP